MLAALNTFFLNLFGLAGRNAPRHGRTRRDRGRSRVIRLREVPRRMPAAPKPIDATWLEFAREAAVDLVSAEEVPVMALERLRTDRAFAAVVALAALRLDPQAAARHWPAGIEPPEVEELSTALRRLDVSLSGLERAENPVQLRRFRTSLVAVYRGEDIGVVSDLLRIQPLRLFNGSLRRAS
jgi:hypothetical protein